MVKVKGDACFDSYLHMETETIFYAFRQIGLGSSNQKQSLKSFLSFQFSFHERLAFSACTFLIVWVSLLLPPSYNISRS